jgi:hypothetical protein
VEYFVNGLVYGFVYSVGIGLVLISLLFAVTGYRFGIVWKNETEVKRYSVPFSWITVLLLIIWVIAVYA